MKGLYINSNQYVQEIYLRIHHHMMDYLYARFYLNTETDSYNREESERHCLDAKKSLVQNLILLNSLPDEYANNIRTAVQKDAARYIRWLYNIK